MPSNFCSIIERNLENLFLRRWIMLLMEVLAVSIIFCIIVSNPTAERNYQTVDNIRNLKWKLTKKINIEDTSMINKEINYISYVSGNQPSTDLVEKAGQRLNLQVIRVPNEKLMESQFNRSSVLCGVVFDNTAKYPKELSVRLRFPNQLRSVKNIAHAQNNFWQYRITGDISDKEAKNKNLFSGVYMREGFLQLQHAIFQEWLTKVKPDAEPHNLQVAWFVFPRDHKKRHILNYSGLITLLYNFAFCFSFCNTVYLYARECQKNMLPTYWRYGYRYSTIWFGNIFITIIKLSILDLIIILILYMTNSDDSAFIDFQEVKFAYFLLFLMLYNIQYIVCAIFYALFMQNGRKSVLLTLTIWFATYGCFTTLLRGNNSINNIVIIILLIAHFNNVFPLGMTYMYNCLEESPEEYWILTGSMIGNILLYLLLISWIQYLKPGRYMNVYKYDFLYWRSIFCRNRISFHRNDKNPIKLFADTPSWESVEYGPLGVEGFVKIKNVCINYKLFPHRYHLKHISMTLFKGEITVLWGHHSSGKTSLISILAGWQIQKLGSITYGDFDLHKDWNRARRLCDVSMPNNRLYDNLTVRSTIVHFVKIKQETKDPEYLRAEVRKWLEVLRPVIPNHNYKISHLNYDQKRLLCLCIVLACDTKIILLDEPTQHMRLKEKNFFWNILRAERTNRVILVATSSLDEANYIGDRIALLDNGKLLAYGTPFFLKTSFSDIYYLLINKNQDAPSMPITNFVLSYIHDITLENEYSSRMVYKVPAYQRPLFQLMLINLEKSSYRLGINQIQMLTSSLNEVAMKLTEDQVKPFDKPSENFFENRKIDEGTNYKMQIIAMIFKKTVNQMPRLWPASMILISIFITLIIGKLSEVLPTPPSRHNATNFGLNSTETYRRGLPPPWSTENCTFIRVKDLKTDEHVKVFNSNNFFFHTDAYECHKGESFERYLTASIPPPKKHIAAIEFSKKNNWIIWLNKRDLEAAPVALNMAHNLILQSNFENQKDYIIKISNDPFLMNVVTKANFMTSHLSHISVPLIAGIVMPFIVSCFILALIEERRSHMWVIQRLAGLHLGIYWIVTLIWDWLTFILFALIFIIVQLIVNIEGIGYKEKLWIYLVIILYGVSALGWIYIMSMFMKKSKTKGFLISLLISFTTGIVAYNLFWDVLKVSNFQITFWHIFMLSPHFAMLHAISSIYVFEKINVYCEEICDLHDGCVKTDVEKICLYITECCELPDHKTQFTYAMACMSISALLSFSGIFIIGIIRTEKGSLTRRKITRYQTACFPYDDNDVRKIREEIAYATAPEVFHKTYIVDQLEYRLPKKPGLLHTISFEAEKGQCISIYGNQRSTTRLAKLLTGIDLFRFGTVYIEGVPMKSQLTRAWNYLGYCPPNRGLYNNFTVLELMRYLAMIAGIPSKDIMAMVHATFQLLNMHSYAHKKCGHLSVDKQRKVNIATAIVVFKSVLILDQPTAGCPLSTSQEIWNVLQYLLQIGRTIIFTSNAVIECRILAHKMLIYERGEMFAYGEFFYIIERYSKGVYLQIKLNRDGDSLEQIKINFQKDIENLYRFVSFLHADAELCTRVDNCLSFYLPIEDVKYSYLFGSLEKNKTRLNISDYTINQGTIEEIMYTILTSRLHRLR